MKSDSSDIVQLMTNANAEVLQEQARSLLKELQYYKEKVLGINKLERGILAELNFLKKTSTDVLDVNCTNLKYYSAIVETLRNSTCPTAVLKNFRYFSEQTKLTEKVLIDVVTENGLNWIKVSKLYKRGIHKFSVESDYSDVEDSWPHSKVSPLIRYAKRMKEASKQNLLHFKVPRITFVTYEEVEDSLVMRLKEEGVIIDRQHKLFCSNTPPAAGCYEHYCARLNLDVTTLIALVSDLTHSLTHPINPAIFKEQPLIVQASQELTEPILPMLSQLFNARSLYTTRSAYTKFLELINLIGGEKETIRANQIFTKEVIQYQGSNDLFYSWKEFGFNEAPFVSIVGDQPSPRFSELFAHPNRPKKFTLQTMSVFGTGDQLKMTTVTGNSSISRSLDQIELKSWSVFEHSPRSLVEKRIFITNT